MEVPLFSIRKLLHGMGWNGLSKKRELRICSQKDNVLMGGDCASESQIALKAKKIK